MLGLTAKREKFVQELIKNKSQREAFRIAYPRSRSWKDENVDSSASNLLKNHKVAARYNELQSKVLAEAEKKCIITATEILEELSRIATADIKDFLEFKTVKTVVDTDKETGEPIIDYAPVVNTKDSSQIDGRVIQEVSINSRGVFTFKLHDKMAALDKLGKYFKLFTDKIEVQAEVNNPLEGLTTEELKKLINSE